MSNVNMTPEQAYDVLVQQVHAPVFFEKLAKVYNIQPQTQEEARELIMMAGQLRHAHEQHNIKSAQVRGSVYTELRKELNQNLNQHGYAQLPDNENAVKEAAYLAVKSQPVIKRAAEIFNSYMTQAISQ